MSAESFRSRDQTVVACLVGSVADVACQRRQERRKNVVVRAQTLDLVFRVVRRKRSLMGQHLAEVVRTAEEAFR